MREYELTVLVHPDLEMHLETATDKVKALIEANGGKIAKEANEGKKRLAYSIKGQDFLQLQRRRFLPCSILRMKLSATC